MQEASDALSKLQTVTLFRPITSLIKFTSCEPILFPRKQIPALE